MIARWHQLDSTSVSAGSKTAALGKAAMAAAILLRTHLVLSLAAHTYVEVVAVQSRLAWISRRDDMPKSSNGSKSYAVEHM